VRTARSLQRRRSLACVIVSVALAGCSQIWILPPNPPGSYKQSIAIVDPTPSSEKSPEFPDSSVPTKGTQDTPPKVRIRYMPNVPMNLGPIHARLELCPVVEIDGTVRDVEVTKSSRRPEVDALYVKAVRTWSFSPAQKDGHAVVQKVCQAFALELG
jgi:TonB family protein